jgi:hypothetical protein
VKFRNFLAPLTIALIFAPMTGPAADSCLAQGVPSHDCCARPPAPERATADSCCAGNDASPARSRVPQSSSHDRCDCVHSPAEPEAVSVGTPTPPSDDLRASSAEAPNQEPIFSRWEVCRHCDRSRGSPTPPLFILDCAFLI